MRSGRSRAGTTSGVMERVAAQRVLVVENDVAAREVIIEHLGRQRLDLRGAATLEDAVAMLESEIPAVVLTDLELGARRGGVELAMRIRSSPRTSGVRSIAMSSGVDPEWPVMRWFDAYLRKPLDFELLGHLVRQYADASLAERLALARTGEH